MPLRVLHVTPSFYPAVEFGGPVASLYELCLSQVRAGHQVRVITSTAGTTGQQLRGGQWVEDFGVPTYYAPVRLPPDLAFQNHNFLRPCHGVHVPPLLRIRVISLNFQ